MSYDVIVEALVFGSIFALVGCGFNVLYRPTTVFNFAQGDLIMVGAIVAAEVTTVMGRPWIVGLAACVAAVAALALVEERVAVTPILRRSSKSFGWIITTLAFSLIVENVVGELWGSDPRSVAVPPGLTLRTHNLHGALISSYDIAVVVITPLIVLGLELLGRTRFGRAVEAVAEDRDAAMLRGIDPVRLTMWAFVLGGGLAGLTGLMAAPLLYASTGMGPQLLLSGFEAAALGGIGSNRGALVAGYAIGFVQAIGASLFAPGYQSLASFMLLLMVLIIRPVGLFGRTVVRDV